LTSCHYKLNNLKEGIISITHFAWKMGKHDMLFTAIVCLAIDKFHFKDLVISYVFLTWIKKVNQEKELFFGSVY
jgi:hypothetical protein